ncbi:hypothetical protein LSG31_16695 [Fodinisporobacter ferrooxydans]|uniref:Gram-positive cocci surface proteins LPxTG domain-containing protein n=1 Tax=Fodinisporobacter ferrooxydans TaxID=2901836 RepID=A0ABY4CG75_9BACL|nr:hypothetical protein LSG31_16695 [Alicyclobacillaceae bacterium MYW30-H2]
MKRMAAFGFIGVATALSTSVAFAATPPPDFQKIGFPTVVAEQTIDPTKATTVSHDNIKIAIPSGAFNRPVKFEILEGPLTNFQNKAPAGETVLMDFAFKVVDPATNTIIGKFNKPVVFSYTDANINVNSKYYDTTTAGTFVLNKIPAKINGTTLSHPILGAPVGWAVTSPSNSVKQATSPVTGFAYGSYAATGAAILLTGASILYLNRRRA